MRSDRAEIRFDPVTRENLPWASALGRDRYGLWSRFEIEGLETPLRWIPPGQFTIGSPKDEAGYVALKAQFKRADGREEPQTEITLASGFWLMDAPVTQALWEEVMGDNPSHFKLADRPVENVSWDDAQSFLDRLNRMIDGLTLGLPSEAQWEYACRAGTTAATYAGAMEILGQRNAPILDGIAWYGGNSGEGYELEDGVDSSDWPEKQYPHKKAGTRPVRLKEPNAWGCHDMLGNVWEWCADAWSDSHEGIAEDGAPRPASQQATDVARVFRGGSWNDGARYVRAACRGRFEPALRSDYLGFRCASVQAGPEGRGGRDDRHGQGREAEPRLDAPAAAGDGQLQAVASSKKVERE